MDDYIALEIDYQTNYIKKELERIADYYGISKRKKRKDQLVEEIVIFEKDSKNIETVYRRKRLWSCIEEIRGDKYPVGSTQYSNRKDFINHSIKLKPGDTFYLTTDGYADQFGGENNSKFKYSKFKQLISDAYSFNGKNTKLALINEHKEWRGSLSQTDDILVLGIFF
jgi:hypothetical protein